MKISELVKKTGVPKETIHFYIREGLLRKPRKSGVNSAEYGERYVDQIQLIKDLRDNYYLPIPEIKKIVKKFKKQSPSDQAVSQFHSKFSRPQDRLLTTEVIGKDAFREATGLGRKWLSRAIEWGLLSPESRDDEEVFSADDVAIGKLMVDMERVGFGPKDDFDPEDLKYMADFIHGYVDNSFNKYYKSNLEKLRSADYSEKASQYHEIISLFFYYLFRKYARKQVDRLLETRTNQRPPAEGV
jgi:DNA-binding transcriptional MerR regulator